MVLHVVLYAHPYTPPAPPAPPLPSAPPGLPALPFPLLSTMPGGHAQVEFLVNTYVAVQFMHLALGLSHLVQLAVMLEHFTQDFRFHHVSLAQLKHDLQNVGPLHHN